MRYYCTFENRPASLIGLKLLALSLEKHCRDFTLYIGFLDEQPELSDWLQRHAPHAVLIPMPSLREASSIWQVKPLLILQLFEMGLTDVTWLDADLLVLRDMEQLLSSLDEQTVLVAQEMDYPFEFNRSIMNPYHLRPHRKLEHCVNGCMIRVTVHHELFVKKLLDCIKAPFFLEQEAKPAEERVPRFHYEQPIIEMLLSTANEDWVPSWPVQFMTEGIGIIQEMGVTTYGLRDRLANGLGWNSPWIVHCLGIKPWDPVPANRSYRSTSVYSAFAETYQDELEESMPWANSAGLSSRIGRGLSLGQPHWMGIGHCLAGKCWRFLRTGTTRLKGEKV